MLRFSKSPPNIPFDGITCTRYDVGYVYSKIVFTVVDNSDLHILFCERRAPKKTARVFYIKNFWKYTALEAIDQFHSFNMTPETLITAGAWGRHFEAGMFEVWHGLGLPLGYVEPLLRPIHGLRLPARAKEKASCE